ncbi:MAG: ABC transporter permease [Rhodothermales bacterium]
MAFNLDHALAAWRRPLEHRRVLSDRDLDEMERHLRDQVVFLQRQGKSEETAFAEAVREMGDWDEAEAAYREVYWDKLKAQGQRGRELQAWAAMLKNYGVLAVRTLRKQKVPAVINVVGLSIALACCVVVYLFLQSYYNLDRAHENGNAIYLVEREVLQDEQVRISGTVPVPLGPMLEADFAQVAQAIRVDRAGAFVRANDHVFEDAVTFVDEGFFDVFTFPLQAGRVPTSDERQTVVLSDETARKYFGEADPLGQELLVTLTGGAQTTATVAGVAAPFPLTASLRFSIVLPFSTRTGLTADEATDWATSISGLAVHIPNPHDVAWLADQMTPYLERENALYEDRTVQALLFDNLREPMPGAYNVWSRLAEAPHPAFAGVMSVIAILMLALACFNYINIALGTAARRVKEIGVRKVMGSSKRQLVMQFMTENLLLCGIALVLGIVLAQAALVPLFNGLFVNQIELSLTENLGLWGFLVGLLAFVGIASGAYPALYVASFQPTAIFRGQRHRGTKIWFTRAFLTAQFVIAALGVMLGIGFVLNGQHMMEVTWGYDPAGTIVIEMQEPEQYPAMRDAARQMATVSAVSATDTHVGIGMQRGRAYVEGEPTDVLRYTVTPDYATATGLRIAEGRFFEAERLGEAATSVIINETFANRYGWDTPLGQSVRLDSTTYTVAGVVADFAFSPIPHEQPAVFVRDDALMPQYLVVRAMPGAQEATLEALRSTWTAAFPGMPFEYTLQENVFERFEKDFGNLSRGVGLLVGLALLIACMGLFGLASQNIARQLKAVSIRKVLGASAGHLLFIVNRRFVLMLAVACVIASALGYAAMGMGIHFAQANNINVMPLNAWPFVLTVLVVFGCAAVAISAQSRRLVRVNPADTLRGE